MASWGEIPQDVLELIARRLAIEDFLAFGAVCTSWRSAAVKETYEAKSKSPWLMTYGCSQVAEFFSPSSGRIYQLELPGSRAQTLSPPRWMLVSKWGYECRIFNPLSRVSIELPSLEKLCHKSRLGMGLDGPKRLRCSPTKIHSIAVSSSPSSSRNYTVMVSVRQDLQPLELAFHRSGEDAWTRVSPATDLPWSTFLRLIHYDGLFVALDAHNHIMTLDERERRMQLRLVLGQNFEGCPYLVECSGSLLVAWKIWGKGHRTVKGFRVIEVDLEKGTQEEVNNLGNASLFLNGNLAFSVEFNAESCLPTIKPNRVYFTEKCYNMEDGRVETYECYGMEDGKVEAYSDATRVYFKAAEWIQPDF